MLTWVGSIDELGGEDTPVNGIHGTTGDMFRKGDFSLAMHCPLLLVPVVDMQKIG